MGVTQKSLRKECGNVNLNRISTEAQLTILLKPSSYKLRILRIVPYF